MFVVSVVMSGRGICDELITRPGVLPTVARRQNNASASQNKQVEPLGDT
jgi:hypothetical protein